MGAEETLRYWFEVRRQIPEAPRKWEQKAKISKKEWNWQRGIVSHPPIESPWNRASFSVEKWESEKHKSLSMPAEGFKGHVATGGSLSGKTGKWGACGWAVVQLDYDEELGPLDGMYGSMEAEFERGPAHHQEGGADGLPLPAHKSDWTHQGAFRQQRNY